MSIFRRKLNASSLIYCQSRDELPCFSLFSRRDLRLEITKLTVFDGDPIGNHEPKAFGFISSNFILPADIEFSSRPVFNTNGKSGYGRGFLDRYVFEGGHFFAKFFINDPDGVIFDKFRVAFEHSLASGQAYQELVLRKEKPGVNPERLKREERRRNMDPQERRKDEEAESESLKTFIHKIEYGDEDLPDINFDQVLFEDSITTKAPIWSYAHSYENLSKPVFHSRATARWRQWRRTRS